MSDSDQTPKRKVLLIGWDGADWDHINPLLAEGLMPTLQGVIDRGVSGNLATLQPVLSPMLWNSVATGKYAFKHGVHGFIEPDPDNGGARPYTSTSRKTKAIWNMLTQEGLRTNVIGWWASHPAEPINGIVVTNSFNGVKYEPGKGWSIPPGTIHPKEKAQELARMRVFPHELTHEHILPFIPNAAKIDQDNDKRLSMFAKTLAECASIQALTTAIMADEPWDLTAVYYDTVDHMSHGFMAYHPPKMDRVSEEDFEMFKDVIKGTYRFHDMMLDRLLQIAGPDTTVVICSDHGFHSGKTRPMGTPREPAGPAVWHRQYGIFIAAGPGIKQNEKLYGASLIDVGPTVLNLMGLPIGQDMDGRPLMEIYDKPQIASTIPSWDDRPGECGMHTEDTVLDKTQSEELLQQFAALGYIENPGDDKEKQAESAEIEAKYNVARNYAWANQTEKAIELMEEILFRRPWEDRFITHLAQYYHAAGYSEQSLALLESAYDLNSPRSLSTLVLYGKVLLETGRNEDGLAALEKALASNPHQSGVHIHLGDVYARLRMWDKAVEAYQSAIDMDDEAARAYQGLSTAYRRMGKNQETVDAAMQAISLLHRLPQAHFNLGVALARAGERERAVFALDTALQFSPRMIDAHRWICRLIKGSPDHAAKLDFHRQQIDNLLAARKPERRARDERKQTRFDLPELPPLEERQKTLIEERPNPEGAKIVPSGKTFTLVSGLPRSGTSLMMQMLDSGGLPAKTDGERTADTDNPRGYYEWEAIKQIAKKPTLMDEEGLDQKAIKVITMLLTQLPQKHKYKVVFMMRPVEEIVASQTKMLEHRGTEGADLDPEQIERGLHAHRDEVLKHIRQSKNFEVLEVSYPDLVADPAEGVAAIRNFLGDELLPTGEAMLSAVDQSLYRNRQPAK